MLNIEIDVAIRSSILKSKHRRLLLS